MIEEEIKTLVQNEVDRQMEQHFDRIEHAIPLLEKMKRDIETTRSTLYKSMQDIQSVLLSLDTGMKQDEVPVKQAPMFARKQVAQKKPESEPEPEPEPEPETEEQEELQWTKEQDGDLDKGETQIWRFGEHTLTVWAEGKKTFAQVDDGAAQEIWKQSSLEKIQKQIEHMEQ